MHAFLSLLQHLWLPRRCVHSPGACQGAAALDEVCPPEAAAAAAAEASRFELVADAERGIAAGEEVTIGYGSWPSDVFLLFFGFAPALNPHDAGERRGAPVARAGG